MCFLYVKKVKKDEPPRYGYRNSNEIRIRDRIKKLQKCGSPADKDKKPCL